MTSVTLLALTTLAVTVVIGSALLASHPQVKPIRVTQERKKDLKKDFLRKNLR